jgi:hypothetical protein
MNLKSKLAGALVRLKKWVSRFQRKREIFLIMEGGVVHEIVDLPDNINVTAIAYDTEGVEKERLEISPVDGELCIINKWWPYARLHDRRNGGGAEAGVEESRESETYPGSILERQNGSGLGCAGCSHGSQ